MIVSGWILPSGIEILCGYKDSSSCYGDKFHLQAVREYVESIKIHNPKVYSHLFQKLKDYTFSDGCLDYESFAIFCLGWVKVGISETHKYIICTNMPFQSITILKYTSLGYVDNEQFIQTDNFDNVFLIE